MKEEEEEDGMAFLVRLQGQMAERREGGLPAAAGAKDGVMAGHKKFSETSPEKPGGKLASFQHLQRVV